MTRYRLAWVFLLAAAAPSCADLQPELELTAASARLVEPFPYVDFGGQGACAGIALDSQHVVTTRLCAQNASVVSGSAVKRDHFDVGTGPAPDRYWDGRLWRKSGLALVVLDNKMEVKNPLPLATSFPQPERSGRRRQPVQVTALLSATDYDYAWLTNQSKGSFSGYALVDHCDSGAFRPGTPLLYSRSVRGEYIDGYQQPHMEHQLIGMVTFAEKRGHCYFEGVPLVGDHGAFLTARSPETTTDNCSWRIAGNDWKGGPIWAISVKGTTGNWVPVSVGVNEGDKSLVAKTLAFMRHLGMCSPDDPRTADEVVSFGILDDALGLGQPQFWIPRPRNVAIERWLSLSSLSERRGAFPCKYTGPLVRLEELEKAWQAFPELLPTEGRPTLQPKNPTPRW